MTRGDTDEFVALSRELGREENKQVNGLIIAGFYLAANHKWATDTDTAEVRAWVAELRSEMEQSLGDIDQAVCERLIYVVLTGDTEKMAGIKPNDVIGSEARMLFKLVYDQGLSDGDFQQFIADSEELAKEWGYY